MSPLKECTIVVAVSVDVKRYVRPQPDLDKIAPGAYAVVLPDQDPKRILWGAGYFRDTQPLYVEAIMRVLNEMPLEKYANAPGADERFVLNVAVQNSFGSSVLEWFSETWLQNAKVNIQSETTNYLPDWERLYTSVQMGRIRIFKAEEAGDLENLLVALMAASIRRSDIPDCPPDAQEGITNMGEELATGQG